MAERTPLRLASSAPWVARSLDDRFIRSPSRQGGESALSSLDRDIIRMLQHDGRQSFARIARKLDTTEKTVRRHVDRLRGEGIIDITTVADPQLLGYGSSALVGITVDPTHGASAVAGELIGLDEVDYVVVCTGRYHLLLEVVAGDTAELLALVHERVRRTPGVLSCEAFPYLRLYYQQPEWNAVRTEPRDGLGNRPLPSLDDVDRRILAALNADGRIPAGQLARSLELSESVVRQRMTRLLSSGAVRVLALTNPVTLGFELIVWLGIGAAPGVKLGDLADELAGRRSISYLAICGGRFDIMAEAICTDEADLLGLLDEEIRGMDGVARLEVLLAGDLHYKRLQPRL